MRRSRKGCRQSVWDIFAVIRRCQVTPVRPRWARGAPTACSSATTVIPSSGCINRQPFNHKRHNEDHKKPQENDFVPFSASVCAFCVPSRCYLNPNTDRRSIRYVSREPTGSVQNTEAIFGHCLEPRHVGSELA